MKKSRLFCKLFSVIFSVFTVCYHIIPCSYVSAMSCEETVKYLSCHNIYLSGCKEFSFFGQDYVEPRHAWKEFMKKMGKTYEHYVIDMWCEMDLLDADSVNFLYLVLHIYKSIFDQIGINAARKVIRSTWCGFRDMQEQANDRVMLKELMESRADEFKNLEFMLGKG